MSAIFLGRFQPFHLGHLSVIQKAVKENDHLFIVIGSTIESFQPANPFTLGERIQMIQSALKEAKIPTGKYSIIPLPNINNYALWPAYVETSLPPFQKIYTGSEIVKELFETHNKNKKTPYKIISVKKELKISATKIRELMLQNKKWEQLVPPSTAKLLKSFKAADRLKKITPLA